MMNIKVVNLITAASYTKSRGRLFFLNSKISSFQYAYDLKKRVTQRLKTVLTIPYYITDMFDF